ncbi:gatA, partial [Symbiodinium sp. KB8]
MRGRDVKDATSLGESGVLPTMDAIKSGNEEEAAQLSGGKAWHSLKDRIKGLTIGIPREFCVEEMSPSVTSAWSRAIEWLQDCGADVRNVSLPSTKHALAAYYIIAPAEAASNLARYDGIRYGFRQDGGNAAGEGSSSDASALHEEMTATRSSGFGEERRILLGNFVLRESASSLYFKKAQLVRSRLKQEFRDVFKEVDLLLTPTAPTPPWGLEYKFNDAMRVYANDITTAP